MMARAVTDLPELTAADVEADVSHSRNVVGAARETDAQPVDAQDDGWGERRPSR
jgi:hypothetical protein